MLVTRQLARIRPERASAFSRYMRLGPANGRQAEAKKADADDDEDGLFKAIRSQQGS